ncbi:hypothetical protein LCGC14_0434290 [marine sediment metagenome]|uniref:Uncharacterized protein n=1 Tax=marine sediment metagenome TaxID=412755 RepID=A0A0F9STH7_9ZZZZ
MYWMRSIISISLLFITGCGTTINVMTPDHIFRVWAPAVIMDCNNVTTEVIHNGWYISDRTMEKVMKAKAK